MPSGTKERKTKKMAQEEEVVVWEWFSDHGRWKPYEPSVVHAIEANSSSTTRFGLGEVDPSMSAYAIDFSASRQIRLNTGLYRTLTYALNPVSCLFVTYQAA